MNSSYTGNIQSINHTNKSTLMEDVVLSWKRYIERGIKPGTHVSSESSLLALKSRR